MKKPIRLKLFGSFSLEVERTEIGPIPKPTQELVARLALAGSRGVDRTELATHLWQDSDEERAHFYLRRSLSQLRSQLGAGRDRLESRDERRLVLDLSGCECDLLEFQAKSREFGDELGLSRAAKAYGGEFLPGHRSEWARHNRDAFKIQQIVILSRLAKLAEERGDLLAAKDWLQEAVRIDSVAEETSRQLMTVLCKLGEYASAAQVFKALRDTLRRAVGLAPSRQTVELYRRLLAEAKFVEPSPEQEPAERLHGTELPTFATPFFGREAAVAELSESLREHRLTTVTGIGGVGKSRLGIHVSSLSVPFFPAGIAFADVSSCNSRSEIEERFSHSLGVSDLDKDLRRLKERISAKLLLLVDGAEKAIGEVGQLVGILLEALPTLHIVATSQAPLQAPDEALVQLGPMTIPSSDADPSGVESVQFFLQCAQRTLPSFGHGKDHLRLTAELCRRLDGLPLALELAAVRLRTLPIGQIVSNLDDRFALLDAGREMKEGQRTLRGVLEWSLKSRPPVEAALFTRLGIFPSSCSASAIHAICADEEVPSNQVLIALSSLVEHSLLIFEPESAGGRYRLLETVRTFARSLLGEKPELRERLLRSHANFYVEASAEAAEEAEIMLDEPNFANALDYFLSSNEPQTKLNGLVLVNRLCPVLRSPDALRLALRAIDGCGDEKSGPMVEALFRAGSVASVLYRTKLSQSLFERAEVMANGLGLEEWTTESLKGSAEVAANQGRLEEAALLLTKPLERYRRSGDLAGEARCLGSFGYVKRMQGQFEEARELTEQALAISSGIDDEIWRLWCMGSLAAIYVAANACAEAIPILMETLELQTKAENLPGQKWNRCMLGVANMLLGEYENADAYLRPFWTDLQTTPDDLSLAWPMLEFGDLKRRQKDYKFSKEILARALQLSRATGSSILELRALMRLSRLGLDAGDLISARAYYSAAFDMSAKIVANEVAEELEDLAREIRRYVKMDFNPPGGLGDFGSYPSPPSAKFSRSSI